MVDGDKLEVVMLHGEEYMMEVAETGRELWKNRDPCKCRIAKGIFCPLNVVEVLEECGSFGDCRSRAGSWLARGKASG